MLKWAVQQAHFDQFRREAFVLSSKTVLNVVVIDVYRCVRRYLILRLNDGTAAPRKKLRVFRNIVDQREHLACRIFNQNRFFYFCHKSQLPRIHEATLKKLIKYTNRVSSTPFAPA